MYPSFHFQSNKANPLRVVVQLNESIEFLNLNLAAQHETFILRAHTCSSIHSLELVRKVYVAGILYIVPPVAKTKIPHEAPCYCERMYMYIQICDGGLVHTNTHMRTFLSARYFLQHTPFHYPHSNSYIFSLDIKRLIPTTRSGVSSYTVCTCVHRFVVPRTIYTLRVCAAMCSRVMCG